MRVSPFSKTTKIMISPELQYNTIFYYNMEVAEVHGNRTHPTRF